MTDRIDLTGIEVYAKHGVLDQEQEKAQVFRVDVVAFTDLAYRGSGALAAVAVGLEHPDRAETHRGEPELDLERIGHSESIFALSNGHIGLRGSVLRGDVRLSRHPSALLEYLYSLAAKPEYQYRHRWEPNMLVFWDNRSTQHSALHDYYPKRRLMHRLIDQIDERAIKIEK